MHNRRAISVDQMEQMTPTERKAAVEAGLVHDLSELPDEFRTTVLAKAKELNDRLSGAGA